MKTLLCVIAAIAFLALPVLAEDVKVTFDGSRLAAGYMDNGAGGSATPGTFAVPDAKARFNVAFDADTSAVLRLNFNNGVANGADYAYIKVANVIKKLAKNDMVNPDIYVGAMKINFGEETWSNNPVDGALVHNSLTNLSGNDFGLEFRQPVLPIELPVTLGYSLSFLNSDNVGTADGSNVKGYALKVMATMKTLPLYFSLSQYDSGALCAANNVALGTPFEGVGGYNTMHRKAYELNVRYDLLEGAQKFDATKSPLFADAKGVFRLAYGSINDGQTTSANTITNDTMMLDALYNVDKQWFVAFRYSSADVSVEDVSTAGGKFTAMSIGGGNRLSDKAMLKLTYTTNTEPSALKVDDDQVALLMTVLW